ncbi:hypothetical protein GCM10011608_55910 [Micromonospora sonchi]|uniref:Uncharacterized protein n=1 Tax=Micromonospora sonchi TaxID=1763543 RepID=A0A917U7C1_9ACTN|nr:hypothetical protein GCM10011608_55910 [Micromonospora sonchi]
MLDHPHRDFRQVEHLPHGPAGHRRPSQAFTTPTTTGRLMRDPLIRISDLPQRAPLMAGLPTRPLT